MQYRAVVEIGGGSIHLCGHGEGAKGDASSVKKILSEDPGRKGFSRSMMDSWADAVKASSNGSHSMNCL